MNKLLTIPTVELTEVWEAIAFIRSHYPEEIFPPLERGVPASADRLSAHLARLTCDNIWTELLNRASISPDRAAKIIAAAAMPAPVSVSGDSRPDTANSNQNALNRPLERSGGILKEAK